MISPQVRNFISLLSDEIYVRASSDDAYRPRGMFMTAFVNDDGNALGSTRFWKKQSLVGSLESVLREIGKIPD